MADFTLRAEHDGDRDFLRALFAAVRSSELGLGGWDGATAQALLNMQFEGQRRYYQQAYPGARYQVVEVQGQAVGRIVVARDAQCLLLVDIALMPSSSGRGIGSALVRALQEEAARAGLALRLHVALENPAEALYRRLGFKETGLSGMHREMEWGE